MTFQAVLSAVQADATRFFAEFASDRDAIFAALLAAEDHRGRNHRGIDWFSLSRAICLLPRVGRLRGVSTIEQQYIRTVVRRDGRLWLCKVREIAQAWRLAGKVEKGQVWAAYLHRAYFGAGMNGYAAARRQFLNRTATLDFHTAAQIVACLKYPRPKAPSAAWRHRHVLRVRYIEARARRHWPDSAIPGLAPITSSTPPIPGAP